MLLYILGGVAVVIALVLIIASTRPDEFRVTRSATFSAPPEMIFPQVNDLHNWQAWSPWAKKDPNAKTSYDGSAAGIGAGFGWAGQKIGEGHMTIIESQPSELIRIKLDFLKPFKATNTAEFTFKSQGNQTTVTWTMYGPQNLFGKVFGLFVNCDAMCGRDFELGLSNIKAIIDTLVPKAHA